MFFVDDGAAVGENGRVTPEMQQAQSSSAGNEHEYKYHPEWNERCISCDCCLERIELKWIRGKEPPPDDATNSVDICIECRALFKPSSPEFSCGHVDYWLDQRRYCKACLAAFTSDDKEIWWRRDKACPCEDHVGDESDDD
jgi:hypothetical protein